MPFGLGIPDLPGLRRDLLAVAVLATTGSLAMGALGPILPMYLDTLGIDASTIGLLFSVSAVAVAIGEFSWGWALDRLNLKLPLAVGTIGLSLVLLALAFTQALPMLFILFFLRGGTFVATVPTSRAFVGTTMGAHQKALFLAVFSTILGVGRTIGAYGGGIVADNLGYAAVFIICSFIAFGGGIAGLPLLRAKRLTHYAEQSLSGNNNGVSQSQRRSGPRDIASFKTQALIAALAVVPIGVTSTFVPLLAKKVILLQPSDVGLLYFISGLVGLGLTVPMGRLSDRFGRRVFMSVGLATSAFAVAGISLADSFAALLVFSMLNALGMAIFQPAAVALFSDTASANKQGTAMGIYGFCEDIGIIAGPAIGGLLWESFGAGPTFWFGAAPAFIGAIVALAAVRPRRVPVPSIAGP